jgi:hypothetical protein
VLLALGYGALAYGHVRAVCAVTHGDTPALAKALGRLPAQDRVPALLERTAPGSWEHALAAEVLAAPDADARVGAVNLALADAEHALGRTAQWPRAAWRLCAVTGLILAVPAYRADRADLRWPIAILVTGGVAMLGCAELGRSGARHAERQRRAIDALVAAALAIPEGRGASAAPGGPGKAPATRRRRRR